MGQQQLLLIVLGVIIVGIAVVVGINLFNANAESSTQDSVVSQATNIGALAQQFYKKPESMGGGGNSFVNFDTTHVRGLGKLLNANDATFSIGAPSGTPPAIAITGIPTDYAWKVTTTVYADSMKSAITNQ